MKLFKLVFIGALLLASFFNAVRAQDEKTDPIAEETDAAGAKPTGTQEPPVETEEPEAPKRPVIEAHPDVTCVAVFPENTDFVAELGAKVPMLLGFRYEGASPLTLVHIGAQLISPHDRESVILNFSRTLVNVSVQGHTERTLLYNFTTSPDRLEPYKFWLIADAYYTDPAVNTSVYRSVFYNGSFELIEKPATVTSRSFFLIFLLVASLVFVGYVVYGVVKSRIARKRRPQQPVERGTRPDGASAAVDPSWQYEVYKQKPTSPRHKKST